MQTFAGVTLKHILKCLGAKRFKQSKEWVNFSCVYAPFFHRKSDTHPSAGLTLKHPYMYNCFSCGIKKPLGAVCAELKNLYGDNKEIDEAIQFWDILYVKYSCDNVGIIFEDDIPEKQERIVWPNQYLEQYPPAYKQNQIHPYLLQRGLNYDIVKRMNFRLDKNRKRVCVPIYDFDGELIGLHGRTFCENNLKYYAYSYEGKYNKNLWLGAHWVNWDKPVIIAESVFDLAKILYVSENVISPLSASLGKEKLEQIFPAYEVITAFDNDEAGDLARRKIQNFFHGRLISHIIPKLDFKDFGAMPEEEIKKLRRYL